MKAPVGPPKAVAVVHCLQQICLMVVFLAFKAAAMSTFIFCPRPIDFRRATPVVELVVDFNCA